MKIESTGHFDMMTAFIAAVFIFATIPVMTLYVLISTFMR
jgi:hypothetical protein